MLSLFITLFSSALSLAKGVVDVGKFPLLFAFCKDIREGENIRGYPGGCIKHIF